MRRSTRRISWSAGIAPRSATGTLACVAPQQRGAATASSQTAEQNKSVVRNFYRISSIGNVADILAVMRDDATYWVSSVQGFSGAKTKAQLGRVLAGVGKPYGGGALRLSPTKLIAEGEWVFGEASGRAALQNGRVYEPHSAWLFRIENGLIVEIGEFIDSKQSYDVFLPP